MTTTQLTPAQHAILAKAINTGGGQIDWFPDHIKGGARKKVLDGTFNRALITPDGEGWRVAAEGYDALGMKRPELPQPPTRFEDELDKIITNAEATPPALHDAELGAAVTAAEATWAKPRTRADSKQATVVRMLKRPEGATVRQICDVTGWQAHTVRGAFAGVFKKKLGLTLVSVKQPGGERIYRVA